jgi:hypothetical protein
LYKDKDYKEFWIDDLKELKEKIRWVVLVLTFKNYYCQ